MTATGPLNQRRATLSLIEDQSDNPEDPEAGTWGANPELQLLGE